MTSHLMVGGIAEITEAHGWRISELLLLIDIACLMIFPVRTANTGLALLSGACTRIRRPPIRASICHHALPYTKRDAKSPPQQ